MYDEFYTFPISCETYKWFSAECVNRVNLWGRVCFLHAIALILNITFLSFDTTLARTILKRKFCSFRAGPFLRLLEIKVKSKGQDSAGT